MSELLTHSNEYWENRPKWVETLSNARDRALENAKNNLIEDDSFSFQDLADKLTTFYYGNGQQGAQNGQDNIAASKDFLTKYSKGLGISVTDALLECYEYIFSDIHIGNQAGVTLPAKYYGGRKKKGEEKADKVLIGPLYRFYDKLEASRQAAIKQAVAVYKKNYNKDSVIIFNNQLIALGQYTAAIESMEGSIANIINEYANDDRGKAAGIEKFKVDTKNYTYFNNKEEFKKAIHQSGTISLQAVDEVQKKFNEMLKNLSAIGGTFLTKTDVGNGEEFAQVYGITKSFREEVTDKQLVSLMKTALTGSKASAVENGELAWDLSISEDQANTNKAFGIREVKNSKGEVTTKVTLDLGKYFGMQTTSPLIIDFRKNIETDSVSHMKADIQLPVFTTKGNSVQLNISSKNYAIREGTRSENMEIKGTFLYNCLRQMQTGIKGSEIIYMALAGDYANNGEEKIEGLEELVKAYTRTSIILNALIGAAQGKNAANVLVLNDRVQKRYVVINFMELLKSFNFFASEGQVFNVTYDKFQIELSQLHREFDRLSREAGRLQRYLTAATQVLANVNTRASWSPLKYSKSNSGIGVYVGHPLTF